MDIQDFANAANVKHIKVIATTSVATIAVATSTSPVMAHANTSQQQTKETHYSQQDNKDCLPAKTTETIKPVVKNPTPAPVPTPVPTPTPAPTPQPVKPVETPKPVVSTPAPVTAPVTKTEVKTAAATTAQPTALPNTGAGDLVAPVAGVGFLGYVGNLFRLKRKVNR